MNEINLIKESLRVIFSSGVSSYEVNDNSYDVRFTYKERNYILHINTNYKFMMLEQIYSVKGASLNTDSIDLISHIREMSMFTEFEKYYVFAFSVTSYIKDDYESKKIQITKQSGNNDLVYEIESLEYKEPKECLVKVVPYDFGLSVFDDRLFPCDWIEDFNELVRTLNEEDLYLMYSTLGGYFYKLSNNAWNDKIIDPFVIDYMNEVLQDEINKRNIEIDSWFNEWNNYFTNENIEIYLNEKKENKTKELN